MGKHAHASFSLCPIQQEPACVHPWNSNGGEGLSSGREELAGVLQDTNALSPLSAQQGPARPRQPQTLNSSTSERSSAWLVFGVLCGQGIEDWRQDTTASLCLLKEPVDCWTCPAGQ